MPNQDSGASQPGRLFSWLPWIVGVMFVAAVLYTARNFSALTPDAADQLIIARHLANGHGYLQSFLPTHPGLLEGVEHVPWMHGILWPFVHAGFFLISSIDSGWARVVGILYVAGTAILAFGIARAAAGRIAGWVALLGVLASPSLVFFGLLGHDDISFSFFLFLVVALMQRALRTGETQDFAWVGVAAAGALLAKPLGVILPALLVVLLLHRVRFGVVGVAARAAVVMVPWTLAFGLYQVRNFAATGSVGFGFGAFEWIYKLLGFDGMYTVYDGPPAISEVLGALGPIRTLEIIGIQWATFAESAARLTPIWSSNDQLIAQISEFIVPSFLPLLGFASTLFLLRTHRDLAVMFLVWGITMVGFVCTIYHFELRYFSTIIGMTAVSLGVTSQLAWKAARAGSRRVPARAFLCLVALTLALSALQLWSSLSYVSDIATERLLCRSTYRWIEDNTPQDARVITLNPWFVTWYSQRESIIWPSGGIEPLKTVSSHYGADWLLATSSMKRVETSRFIQDFIQRDGRPLFERVQRSEGCVLFRRKPGRAGRN